MLKGKSIGVLDIEKMSLSYVPLKGATVQTGVTADGKYALASVYDAKVWRFTTSLPKVKLCGLAQRGQRPGADLSVA